MKMGIRRRITVRFSVTWNVRRRVKSFLETNISFFRLWGKVYVNPFIVTHFENFTHFDLINYLVRIRIE